jgi:hypothetical protein
MLCPLPLITVVDARLISTMRSVPSTPVGLHQLVRSSNTSSVSPDQRQARLKTMDGAWICRCTAATNHPWTVRLGTGITKYEENGSPIIATAIECEEA